MRSSSGPTALRLLSSSRSASRKRDASYRAHVHLAPSIHMSCGEWESECSGRSRNGGKWSRGGGGGGGVSSGKGIVPAERAALGSNYSERSIFCAPFPLRFSRGSTESAVIHGRKLDRRAADRPTTSASRRFFKQMAKPRQLAGEEISLRDRR